MSGFLEDDEEQQQDQWDFGGLQTPKPQPTTTTPATGSAPEWDFGGLATPASTKNVLTSTIPAPPAPKRATYGEMADTLHAAPAPVTHGTSSVDSGLRLSGQIDQAGNMVPNPGQPLPAPYKQPGQILAEQAGPSMDEIAEAKKQAGALPISTRPPLVDAALGGKSLGTAPPEQPIAGARPGVPVHRSRTGELYQTPEQTFMNAGSESYEQAVGGAQKIFEAGLDTSPVPPSTEPLRRSRTGALYQPPPPIDPRTIGGAADIAEAAMTASTPLLAGGALGAPLETGAALAKGVAASAATAKALETAGASPETTRLVSDVAGAVAAGVPLRETIKSVVQSVADSTRAAADAAAATSPTPRRRYVKGGRVEPNPNDITITPEPPAAEGGAPVRPSGPPPAGPQGPRPDQAPPTPTPPVAAGPGGGAAVGPVAPSPEPPPVAPAVPPALDFTGLKDARGHEVATEPVTDTLDTGEQQGRLPGAEGARQAGKADTTFKAPQQASGQDFDLTGLETDEARAKREAEEKGPALFNEAPETTTGYDNLNDHERRELRRMLAEMEAQPFTKHSFIKDIVGIGGGSEIVPGAGGAPVFNDIGGNTRVQVQKAIQRVLDGKKPTSVGQRAIDVARKRLKGDWHTSAPTLPPEAGDEPGKTYVPQTPDMTAEELAVEKPFREAVEQRTPEMVAEYVKRFGNVIDADKAKELSPEYAASNEARGKFNRAVHRSSSRLAYAVYEHLLQQPTPEGKQPVVDFITGPTGAGKSTVQTLPGVKEALASSQIIVDGPLTEVGNAQIRIQKALDAGKDVHIVYVHRDPVEAWHDGVLPRAEATGRQTPLDYHVKSHVEGLRTIRVLAHEYADHPHVSFEFLENRNGEPVKEIGLADLPEAYNEGDVRAAIEARPAAEVPAPRGAREEVEESSDRGLQQNLGGVPGGTSREVPGGRAEEVAPSQPSTPSIPVTPRASKTAPAKPSVPVTPKGQKDEPPKIRNPRSINEAFLAALKPFKGSDGQWYYVDTRQPDFRNVNTLDKDGFPEKVRGYYPGSGFYHDSIPDVTFEGSYERPSGSGEVEPTTPTKDSQGAVPVTPKGVARFPTREAATQSTETELLDVLRDPAQPDLVRRYAAEELEARGISVPTVLAQAGPKAPPMPKGMRGTHTAGVAGPAGKAQNVPDERPGSRESRPEAETPLGGAPAQDGGAAASGRDTGEPPARDGAADADAGGDADSAGARPGPGARDDAGDRVPARGGRQRARAVGLDYRIAADDPLGDLPDSRKLADNVAAVRLLDTLTKEGRKATAEEQKTLVRYVGWGGLSSAFKPGGAGYAEVRKLLTDGIITQAEYDAMRASTPNAHYTSRAVVSAMYDAVARLGLTKGRVLEPSTGAGHFFGLMPEALASQTTWAGIELDPITARLAQQLYQSANIQATGFEQATLPANFFDLAIGNPPFGNYPVHDPAFTGPRKFLTKALHNYFFAKTLDVVRPGGLVAFVTSHYTMDAKDSGVRRYLDQHAELVGAIRLPNTAFKRNAWTEVVTDILFLKKRAEPKTGGEPSAWVNADEVDLDGGRGHDDSQRKLINHYFLEHPRMVLGRHATTGSMYSGKEYTVEPTGDLAEQLADAVTLLPEHVIEQQAPKSTEPTPADLVPAPGHVKPFAFTTAEDGKLYVRDGANLVSQEGLPDATKARIRGMMRVRDALRETMRLMLDEHATDAQIERAQAGLTTVYDAFVKAHGYLTTRGNIQAFGDDPDKPLLLSLEDWDPETEKAKKAPIFTKRVLSPRTPPTSADSPKSALLIALNESGRVDWARMSALTGQPAEHLQQALEGVVYETPSGDWQTSDDYLSGNVRAKLTEAKAAAAVDPRFKANVEALEKVQPEDLGPKDIDARLGAPWIPTSDVEAFVAHVTDGTVRVRYLPPLAQWTLAVVNGHGTVKSSDTYGTGRKNAYELIELALNLKQPTVYDKGPNNTSVVNQKETLAARAKQEDIKDEFKKWLWADAARGVRLARFYNDHFNNLRLRQYDGSHLTLPGMAAGIALRPHQSNAIWRALTNGNTLFAHVVGAGKTFAIIGTAMEMRRLGLAKKPLITVPNHLVEQWGAEFNRMYPTAKVLIATKKDFESDRRKRLMARIATGDWDAVIVAHSSFGRVPVQDATFEAFIQEQIETLEHFIEEERGASGKSAKSVKEMEKAKRRLEAKLKERRDREKQDDTVAFEELGVDALFVDEAHLFKNLWFPTKMTRVAGLPNSESSRAFDMFLKTRHVQQVTNGRGVVFATGTPISNTMAEMFTMQRYLAPRQLAENGLAHFDAWAQQFGEIVSSMELAPEGKGYRIRNRFARFTNFAELAKLFRSFADVQTAEMLNLPTPKLKGDAPTLTSVKPSAALTAYVETLVTRADRMRRTKVDPRVDNMLKVTGDGRKAALDLRLVGLPQPPGGKLDVAADRIATLYRETTPLKGTQLVFSDLGTPKETGKKKGADDDAAPVFDADDSGFNVYETLRDKLIAQGIPKKEIAFIHDANTDARKLALFNDVKAGRVRVLIGSTEKMGAGMNVQNRLIAEHHLDAPWRPSDVEQRDGRIIRQGNELYNDGKIADVEIIRYLAEGSFDAYMWQTLETKAKFISQAMSGNIDGRSVEDVDVVMINSAAQAKAIASGNPMVFEKVKIDAEVAKLQSLRTSWEDSRWRLRNDLAILPKVREARQRDLADLEAMQAAVTLPEKWAVTIGKKTFDERKVGGERLIAAARKAFMEGMGNGYERIGTFAGLDIVAQTVEEPKKDSAFAVGLRHEDAFIELGYVLNDADPMGWAARLMNGIGHIEERVANVQREIARIDKRLVDAKAQGDIAWDKAGKLADALKEQDRLNKALDLDAKSQAEQAPAADDDGDDDSGSGVNSMPVNRPPNMPLPTRPGSVPVTDRMRPSAILERLRKGLGDIPVSVGRFRQHAIGIYKQKPQAVRAKVANDVQTIVHEFGHHIDHAILGISRRDKRWRDELQALGQPTSRPSYTAGQQRQEGAAEFLRLYLLEPATAQADAPQYFAEFERRLEDHPELKTVLHEARADLAGLIAQDPATRGRLRIDFTGTDSATLYQRLKDDPKSVMRDLATLWVDDLQALRTAVDQMADARPIDARQNAYILARNARGTAGMAEGMLEHGVRARNGRFVSGSLADAITPVRAHLEDFAAYLVARRVLEVKAQKGKETGMSPAEARAIVQQVESGPQAAEMRRAADNVHAYNRALLQYAREYKVLSQDQYTKLLREVEYVPLQRVMETISGSFANSGARKIANRTSPIKRMKGSGRDIINPLESIIRNTFTIVDTVEKNRAMRALTTQIDKSAGSAKWMERVPTPQVATQFNLSQVAKDVSAELDAAGIDLPDNFDLDGFVTVFTPATFATPGQNLVTVLRDGKREFYEVHDQALFDAMNAIGGRATSTLIEWASKPAALLRAGATLTPGFIARNPTRDTLVAFMQSRYGFIPVYDTLRGFLSLALGDDDAKLFLTSGVQQSALVGADRDRLRKKIREMSVESRAAFFKNVVLHPLDLLRALSETMEASTRLGEFRLAVNAGGQERRAGILGVIQRAVQPNNRQTDDETLTRATLAARDVTTDFSRGGSVSREANRVFAFFNARIQGYIRMVETAQRDPSGTALNVALLALLSAALWYLHEDEKEYEELPDWEKNAYWHIPLGKGYIKVAKPFEWAVMANVTEAALSKMKGDNPDALNRVRMTKDDAKQLMFAVVPSALLPWLEAGFNYDTFRDQPIVKPWDVGLEPVLQKSDWTTDTALELGKLMGVAPAKIDHIIFGYGAGFARGVVDYGTDPALHALGITPRKAPAPTPKWQRAPVAGTFYREKTYDSSSQSLKDFYTEYQKVIDGQRSLGRFAKTDTDAGRQFVQETDGETWRRRGEQLKAGKKEMEALSDVINAIYAAPPDKATPQQKRQALDRVYRDMVDIARRALGRQPLPVTARSQ